ncbi:MAG: type I-E CRISPR-associated protein Cas6/Cse3/CasE [Candidatus Sumerlaeia bacterium]|nr:type I-E CRISPR-associated protein Cas6/Cse3/CasE [Candidatus Sumerlaeia bacterium]
MTTIAPPVQLLFLSRLQLSPRSRQAANDLANPYELHKTLLRAFDGGNQGEAPEISGRLLFRIEPGKTYSPAPPVVLVQAHTLAIWQTIADRFPSYFAVTPEQKRILTTQFQLEVGSVVAFRLRANPIRNEPIKGTKRGKRRPLLDEKQQLDWFQERLNRNGANILHSRVWHEGVQSMRKGKSSRSIQIVSSFVEGTLEVTDGLKLSHALAHGIGPGKAFGFGLLSLAPAR